MHHKICSERLLNHPREVKAKFLSTLKVALGKLSDKKAKNGNLYAISLFFKNKDLILSNKKEHTFLDYLYLINLVGKEPRQLNEISHQCLRLYTNSSFAINFIYNHCAIQLGNFISPYKTPDVRVGFISDYRVFHYILGTVLLKFDDIASYLSQMLDDKPEEFFIDKLNIDLFIKTHKKYLIFAKRQKYSDTIKQLYKIKQNIKPDIKQSYHVQYNEDNLNVKEQRFKNVLPHANFKKFIDTYVHNEHIKKAVLQESKNNYYNLLRKLYQIHYDLMLYEHVYITFFIYSGNMLYSNDLDKFIASYHKLLIKSVSFHEENNNVSYNYLRTSIDKYIIGNDLLEAMVLLFIFYKYFVIFFNDNDLHLQLYVIKPKYGHTNYDNEYFGNGIFTTSNAKSYTSTEKIRLVTALCNDIKKTFAEKYTATTIRGLLWQAFISKNEKALEISKKWSLLKNVKENNRENCYLLYKLRGLLLDEFDLYLQKYINFYQTILKDEDIIYSINYNYEKIPITDFSDVEKFILYRLIESLPIKDLPSNTFAEILKSPNNPATIAIELFEEYQRLESSDSIELALIKTTSFSLNNFLSYFTSLHDIDKQNFINDLKELYTLELSSSSKEKSLDLQWSVDSIKSAIATKFRAKAIEYDDFNVVIDGLTIYQVWEKVLKKI